MTSIEKGCPRVSIDERRYIEKTSIRGRIIYHGYVKWWWSLYWIMHTHTHNDAATVQSIDSSAVEQFIESFISKWGYSNENGTPQIAPPTWITTKMISKKRAHENENISISKNQRCVNKIRCTSEHPFSLPWSAYSSDAAPSRYNRTRVLVRNASNPTRTWRSSLRPTCTPYWVPCRHTEAVM